MDYTIKVYVIKIKIGVIAILDHDLRMMVVISDGLDHR